MNKILIGSNNQAKINTYKRLLEGLNLQIVSAKDLKIPAPEENANNYEDEAVKKARYYFQKSGIPSIVDDGGFEIEALNGEPGIKSRRWIGREMTDQEIIDEVFKRMQGQTNRACKHTIVLALASPFGVFLADGDVAGVVAKEPSAKRHEHFPYRSVMFLPKYNKYWVDLTSEEEEILNHRKHAIEKIKDIFQELSK